MAIIATDGGVEIGQAIARKRQQGCDAAERQRSALTCTTPDGSDEHLHLVIHFPIFGRGA